MKDKDNEYREVTTKQSKKVVVKFVFRVLMVSLVRLRDFLFLLLLISLLLLPSLLFLPLLLLLIHNRRWLMLLILLVPLMTRLHVKVHQRLLPFNIDLGPGRLVHLEVILIIWTLERGLESSPYLLTCSLRLNLFHAFMLMMSSTLQ